MNQDKVSINLFFATSKIALGLFSLCCRNMERKRGYESQALSKLPEFGFVNLEASTVRMTSSELYHASHVPTLRPIKCATFFVLARSLNGVGRRGTISFFLHLGSLLLALQPSIVA
jgi:hypothetical protein